MTDFDRSPITANPARPAAAGIPPADSTPTAKQRRRWLRFLILLAAVAGLWSAHGPVLRSVGGLLVSDEPVGQYQYVGLCGRDSGPDGDRAYDAAAALFRQHPSCHILVIQTAALRLVETGILASLATLSRRELAARGVPAHTLVATSRDGGDDWATARALRVWLSDHPTDSIVLLCARFEALTSATRSVRCSIRRKRRGCGCTPSATGDATKPIGGRAVPGTKPLAWNACDIFIPGVSAEATRCPLCKAPMTMNAASA